MLAPQRGLIATGQSQKQDLVSYRPARVFVIGVKRTPGFVELLLPPREVRGNVVYRSFCRIGTKKVPDAKTLVRLGQAIGADTLCELQAPMVTLARERGVIRREIPRLCRSSVS